MMPKSHGGKFNFKAFQATQLKLQCSISEPNNKGRFVLKLEEGKKKKKVKDHNVPCSESIFH